MRFGVGLHTHLMSARATSPGARIQLNGHDKPHLLRTKLTPSLKGTTTTSTRGSLTRTSLKARTASADGSATLPGRTHGPVQAVPRQLMLSMLIKKTISTAAAL